MLLHVVAQVAAVHPLGDQVHVLLVLDALHHLCHVVRAQLQIGKSLAHRNLRHAFHETSAFAALALDDLGRARVLVNDLNRDFGSAVAVLGLDDGEGALLAFLVVDDVGVDLTGMALHGEYLCQALLSELLVLEI